MSVDGQARRDAVAVMSLILDEAENGPVRGNQVQLGVYLMGLPANASQLVAALAGIAVNQMQDAAAARGQTARERLTALGMHIDRTET